MLGLILFIRTLAVGTIFIVGSIVSGLGITRMLKHFELISSRTTEGLIGVGIIVTFWIIYRLYFQQYLYLDNDDEKS